MALSRSEQMSRIRGRDTSPELRLRSALWRAGLRYRCNARTPVGRPDVIFAGKRIAVFVDGCQWHGCPDHYVRPRSRQEFWDAKLAENVGRDRRQTLALERAGWRVARFWEHEVFERLEEVVAKIRRLWEGGTDAAEARYCVVRVDSLPAHEREVRYLEDLRDAEPKREVEQQRSTRKWKRLP